MVSASASRFAGSAALMTASTASSSSYIPTMFSSSIESLQKFVAFGISRQPPAMHGGPVVLRYLCRVAAKGENIFFQRSPSVFKIIVVLDLQPLDGSQLDLHAVNGMGLSRENPMSDFPMFI